MSVGKLKEPSLLFNSTGSGMIEMPDRICCEKTEILSKQKLKKVINRLELIMCVCMLSSQTAILVMPEAVILFF